MDRVVLRGTDIETTRLAFGCASLLRLPSSHEREALLEAAYEAGIRHFDVARTYGLGAAEAELGRFASRRRSELVLATKFGIAESAVAQRIAGRQAPLRRVIRRLPGLRRAARRIAGAAIGAGRDYSVAAARKSLQTSLRELRTDYIDLFLLHEPPADTVLEDDVIQFLEARRLAGTIRAWGVSGDAGAAVAVAATSPTPLPVLQLHAGSREPLPAAVVESGAAVITYGVLSAALPKVAKDRSDGSAAELLLRTALQENAGGPVVFATTRRDHLAEAAHAGVADPVRDRAARAFVEALAR